MTIISNKRQINTFLKFNSFNKGVASDGFAADELGVMSQDQNLSILQIEELINRTLPNDFKQYIENLEIEFLSPSCSFTLEEPNAFGGSAIVDTIKLCSLDYLRGDENFELGMLCIGGNMMGNLLYMSIRDKDYGSIYYWDHDNKYFWEDDFFYKMYPNLHKNIVKYLNQRKNGALPAKEENYENFYLAAPSFKEFLVKLKPEEY